MSIVLSECSNAVRRLHAAVLRLERAAVMLRVAPLERREWFESLRRKLAPQLKDDAFLVVAVVGGTNIGKSVVFNHIAGSRASATHPLASGTKNPVCLIPPGFGDEHSLPEIFQDFALKQWTHPDEPLRERAEHCLYWQECEQTPENLLVLDTPDIDGDAQINWERADNIRRCADVLIAVLTQQKYNDAAVKQFFRTAAADDVAVIVVFNQCELPEDEEYWPLWLETFCTETGILPEFVYIAPNDRRAAEENRLSFYERQWPRTGTTSAVLAGGENVPRSLTDDLSRLRFAEVKLRSLRGTLRHLLDRETGAPAYLKEIEQTSAAFEAAAGRLSSESVVKIHDWPVIPTKLLVKEIRKWWKQQHEGWASRVDSFYDTLSSGVLWPVRFARSKLGAEQVPPLDSYRRQEWSAVLRAVEEVFDKLTWMSESGSELLRPHFNERLAGKSREQLLENLRQQHEQIPLADELEEVVASQMKEFKAGSPDAYKFYRQLNNISAAVRPMTSVVLFTMGWGPAGEVVAPLVADAATQAVIPVVANFAGGTAAAVAGETAVSGAAGQGSGFLQAKFQRLQSRFTQRRAAWVVEALRAHLLGTLPEDLRAAADVQHSEVFEEVRAALGTLEEHMKNELEEAAT